MLVAATGIVSNGNLLCAQHPQRVGALNGIVSFTEGIGKMLGPAITAPVL